MDETTRTPTEMSLPELVSAFVDLGNELRWRVEDVPNPLFEDQSGRCIHDAEVGHSWRCPERTGLAKEPTHHEVTKYIRKGVGKALWKVLDGYGEDVTKIEGYR